jgi:transmembrane sensor
MKNSSHPSSRAGSAADEQASLWAARLEGGTLDAADRTALDTWLAASPQHRALLSDYCQFSADLEQSLPALVSAGAVNMPATAQPSRRRWSFSWLTLAGGTLAAAAAVALFFTLAPTGSSGVETLATSVAQRQAFTLSDGTRVELNAQTSLRVENTRDERRVRLASGQAYFAVAKDASRPFIVETPTGSVRVTGTIFDVRTDKVSELDVTVVEGSVQVRPMTLPGQAPSSPRALTASEQLSTGPAGVQFLKLTPTALDEALAWRQGLFVSSGLPLGTALARFAHFHGRGLTATPGAEKLRIAGRYALSDLDGFLDKLSAIHTELRVDREPNGLIRVRLASEL